MEYDEIQLHLIRECQDMSFVGQPGQEKMFNLLGRH